MARLYPIFLDLRDRRAVVVGGGRVAGRKAAGLMQAGARVRVIAPDVLPTVRATEVERRRYRPGDLKDAFLAFAATNDRAVNHAVAVEARRRRILVNVADSPEECSFQVPARVVRRGIQLAISTGGRDPKLAKQLRRRLEKIL